MTTDYIKFWFSSKERGATAALVLSREQYAAKSITELSAMYPMSEAPKMRFLHAIDGFKTVQEAIEYH